MRKTDGIRLGRMGRDICSKVSSIPKSVIAGFFVPIGVHFVVGYNMLWPGRLQARLISGMTER